MEEQFIEAYHEALILLQSLSLFGAVFFLLLIFPLSFFSFARKGCFYFFYVVFFFWNLTLWAWSGEIVIEFIPIKIEE